MIVHVFDYEYGSNAEKCGLKHGEQVDLTPEEIVGLLKHCNIMFYRYKVDKNDKLYPRRDVEGKAVLLALDSKNFTQR